MSLPPHVVTGEHHDAEPAYYQHYDTDAHHATHDTTHHVVYPTHDSHHTYGGTHETGYDTTPYETVHHQQHDAEQEYLDHHIQYELGAPHDYHYSDYGEHHYDDGYHVDGYHVDGHHVDGHHDDSHYYDSHYTHMPATAPLVGHGESPEHHYDATHPHTHTEPYYSHADQHHQDDYDLYYALKEQGAHEDESEYSLVHALLTHHDAPTHYSDPYDADHYGHYSDEHHVYTPAHDTVYNHHYGGDHVAHQGSTHFYQYLEPHQDSGHWDASMEYASHLPYHADTIEHPYQAHSRSIPIGHPSYDYLAGHHQVADSIATHGIEDHYYDDDRFHEDYGLDSHHSFHDSGSCWKKAASRTSGIPVSSCGANQDRDEHLCYDKCDQGFLGHGPVCW